ncbi:MAG: metal ABC transporter permease [Acidimicrobiales bacterium]
MSPHLGWDVAVDVRQLLAYHFMVNALRAATITAVVGGVAGWLMVLRRQTFAGHTLSVVAFPGAAGAALLGVGAAWGYFGLCLAAAVVIGAVPYAPDRRAFSEEPAVVGTVQAVLLGAGFLFMSLSKQFLSGVDSLLFGTFLGVTDAQVLTLLAVGAAVLVSLAALGRPLLFASVDPSVASSRGVPVRLVGVGFALVLGATVAEVSQITGALLVFALLVMPAAGARRLTSRTGLGLAVSVALALVVAWVGLGLSYFYAQYPSGFYICTVGFAVYLLSGVPAAAWRAATRRRTRLGSRRRGAGDPLREPALLR